MKDTIKFKDKNWKIEHFLYFNKRKGILLVEVENEKNSFNATINISSVRVAEDSVIIKDHDYNKGLLNVLVQEGIVSKQNIPITFGYNKVYNCKLL